VISQACPFGSLAFRIETITKEVKVIYTFRYPQTEHQGFNKKAEGQKFKIGKELSWSNECTKCLYTKDILEASSFFPHLLTLPNAWHKIAMSWIHPTGVFMYKFYHQEKQPISLYVYEAKNGLPDKILYTDHMGPNWKTYDVHYTMGKLLEFGWNDYKREIESPYLGYINLEHNYVSPRDWGVKRKTLRKRRERELMEKSI